jgi:hypothetical protein
MPPLLQSRPIEMPLPNFASNCVQNRGAQLLILGLKASKANCINRLYGAGDGNRPNPNEPNKGVTTRFSVQLESNGVKST